MGLEAHGPALIQRAGSFLQRHPRVRLFFEKVLKDNITFLASAVSWTLFTSVVPIVASLVAITSFFLRSPATRASVVDHLSNALQGTLSPQEIDHLASVSVQHSGIFAIVGVLGILWAGSNVGGSFSTVFQPIFEVNGRDFLKEKALDVAMIFVFVILMLVIIISTTAGAIISRFFPAAPVPGGTSFIIGILVSLAAAFLLFSVLYIVFPNAQPRFTVSNVWRGAFVAAVLFQILTFIWPLYTGISHFSRYGAVLAPIVVLAAWIYFFALILMFGAEVVAFGAILEANRKDRPIGPEPENYVPQHTLMREDVEQVER